MNLPNKLTLARVCAIPVIIIVALIPFFRETIIYDDIANPLFWITLEDIIIVVLFALASFTDFLDGYLARKNNLVTDFGKFMDPLADKMLVLSALIILLERGRFQAFGFGLGFVITLILAREFMVMGIRVLAASNNIVIAASKLGKLKTVTQMIMIIILLVGCCPFNFISETSCEVASLILIGLAGILTLVSGFDYLIKNKDIVLKTK